MTSQDTIRQSKANLVRDYFKCTELGMSHDAALKQVAAAWITTSKAVDTMVTEAIIANDEFEKSLNQGYGI